MKKQNEHSGEYLAFSDLNRIIEKKLGQTRCFVIGQVSFLKVFQHAMTYAANGWDQKLLVTHWHLSEGMLAFREVMRSLRKGRKKVPIFREILIVDPGRPVTIDGQMRSIYFDRIVEFLGRKNISIVTTRSEGKSYSDYLRSNLDAGLSIPDATEREMLRTVRKVYHQAVASNAFSEYELRHIGSSLLVFFSGFRYWYQLLRGTSIKRCLFTTHYHNEGLIAALSALGIHSGELQHGLIAGNDVYNVYPKIFADAVHGAFFPDVLYVYGNYWKRLVLKGCEHTPEQVVVAGNYLLGSDPRPSSRERKQNIILVCAQKKMAPKYVEIAAYLQGVLELHSDWRVMIRLHPLEDQPEVYMAMQNDRVTVCPKDMTLSSCLEIARIQLSIYSTTFFDALGFDVINFALPAEGYEAYVEEMVQEKVAFTLGWDEDIINRFRAIREARIEMPDRSEVYASFEPQRILIA